MLIIGVDASPKRIAYAIAHQDKILAHDLIHTPPADDPLGRRREAWAMIRQRARQVERAWRMDVTHVAIEDVHIGVNRRGSLDHALCVGQMMARSHLTFPNTEQLLVQPASWRKWCGLPRSGKEPAAAFAATIPGYMVASQDEADAVCIAIATMRAHADSRSG